MYFGFLRGRNKIILFRSKLNNTTNIYFDILNKSIYQLKIFLIYKKIIIIIEKFEAYKDHTIA